MSSDAVERVWSLAGADPRAAMESGLAPTDLQTMLLAVSKSRAASVTPSRLIDRWRSDRFVTPSVTDPRLVAHLESQLWKLVPERFAGLSLSPVAPLGVCSALGPVDQNRVVSTVRGTEVVSDLTNVMAVEAAVRRKVQGPLGRVDLAACHRVLRAQSMDKPGFYPHFKLFALVSSGRDSGSGQTEARMLIDQLGVWGNVLATVLPRTPVRLGFSSFGAPLMQERFADTVRPALSQLPGTIEVAEDPSRTQGAGYYSGGALSISVSGPNGEVDLGDGGLTTWTAQLTSDAKERCLISCIAVERLAALVPWSS